MRQKDFPGQNPFTAMDRGSEDFSPSWQEIRSDQELHDGILRQLKRIKAEFDNPDQDYYGYGGTKRVTSPEDLWNELIYINIDMDPIKDPELKKPLETLSRELDRRILDHFLPYLHDLAKKYGEYASYEGKYAESIKANTPDPDTIRNEFTLAYEAVRRQGNMDEDNRFDLINQIDRAKERFERYVNEPLLYKFEQQEIEWQRNDEWRYYDPIRSPSISSSFEDASKHAKNLEALRSHMDEAQRLVDLSLRMSEPEIAAECKNRAEGYLNWSNVQYARYAAPREMLILDNKLKTLEKHANHGSVPAPEELKVLQNEFASLDIAAIASNMEMRSYYSSVKDRLERIVRKSMGEDVPLEAYDIDPSDINWATRVLGVDLGASAEDIKKAYRTLAKKLHPDKHVDPAKKTEMSKAMKKVNAAYEFLKDMGKV